MARSRRRTSQRTTTQRAANLIALALPAPIQRVADTRIGSLLMLVGAPVMIMFGLLNITWVDGFPTFTLNRNKAVELRNAASEQINNLENQAISQNWSQTTVDILHAAQNANHDHQMPTFPSTQPQATNQSYDPQQLAIYQKQLYDQQLRQQQYPSSQQQYPSQQYPQAYQQQYPQTYQQPYSQPFQPQQFQQQPYQQQQYHPQTYQQPATPSTTQTQQTNQQWPAVYSQQPYQANAATYGQTQAGGYPVQQYNYPLPSTSNRNQSQYSNQGQLGRY